MFRNFFKIAWRNMTSHKGYTLINVLGLALGISACLVLYLITSFEFSYDTFHPDKERIYRLVRGKGKGDHSKDHWGIVPAPLPIAVREELTGLETVTAFHNYYAKVSIPAGSREARKFDSPDPDGEVSPIIVTEPQYFDIFKYEWLAGNAATSLKDPDKVVLAESEAHKYFPSETLDNIVGREVIYNDSLHLTVSGIVKDWTKNTDFIFKDFISFSTIRNSILALQIHQDAWNSWNTASQAYVKLAKGVTPAEVEKQFPSFNDSHGITSAGSGFILQPLSDIHFDAGYKDMYSRKAHLPTLYSLMGFALFILVIAAINFINLSTAQSIHRAKEIGVRKVLGSSKTSLVWQFLSETFLLTCLAVLVAVCIARPVLFAFHAIVPEGVGDHLFHFSTIIFLVLIAVIISLLSGFYPAKVLSSYSPVISLKGQTAQKGNQTGNLRKGLIVFQFTISLVFIIGAIIIGDQIRFLQNNDMGFAKDAIINIKTLPSHSADKKDLLATKIRQLPGIEDLSVSWGTPASEGHLATFLKYGDYDGVNNSIEFGDENFIPFYRLKIIAGRNLMPSDTIGEVVINETSAKALGFAKPEEAIGKLVTTGYTRGDTRIPVVGVVADFHISPLYVPISPMFITTSERFSRSINVKLATQGKQISNFKAAIAEIKRAWKEVYPNDAFNYSFFDETIARFYDKEQRTAQVINTAMIITIFISCMGLVALAMFTAELRTKEIGIRKVLGASVADITTMLSKDFIVLVGIAIVVASPIAWYCMTRWLEDFAYRIHISGWVFVLAGLGTILIAMITVSFQAIRAALANPVRSLRTE